MPSYGRPSWAPVSCGAGPLQSSRACDLPACRGAISADAAGVGNPVHPSANIFWSATTHPGNVACPSSPAITPALPNTGNGLPTYLTFSRDLHSRALGICCPAGPDTPARARSELDGSAGVEGSSLPLSPGFPTGAGTPGLI